MSSPPRSLLAWALPVSLASFCAAYVASFCLIPELVVVVAQCRVVVAALLISVVVVAREVVVLTAVVVVRRATTTFRARVVVIAAVVVVERATSVEIAASSNRIYVGVDVVVVVIRERSCERSCGRS